MMYRVVDHAGQVGLEPHVVDHVEAVEGAGLVGRLVRVAFGPGDEDIADRIIERFGLEGSSARSVEQLFNSAGEVESAVTWVGAVILILATLSWTALSLVPSLTL
jgi:hypothetical protein